jgi:hypothetical protein
MKRSVLIAALFYLFATTFAQSKWDFESDSLFVVWGEKNYSGKQDCSAKARITSNDTSIIVEVEVTDDNLIFNNDPLNSDHVEIWFALRYLYNYEQPSDNYYEPDNVTAYLYGNTSYLYLYKGKCDLSAFNKEIKSPVIESEAFGGEMSYDKLSSDENWLKEKIDIYLSDLRGASLKKTHVFYGVVHLGVLPKTSKAILYDKEAYAVLQKQAGVTIPDYSQFMKVESNTTENGYSVKMVLPPQALGFVTNIGLQNGRFVINIIDSDTPGKQETLLSTSQKQKWGEPATFNELRFHTDIQATLFSKFQAFGTAKNDNTIGPELRGYLSHVFMYTTKGWVPLDREYVQFYEYDQPASFTLPNIQKCRFKRGTLDYEEKTFGKHVLGYLNTSKSKLLTIDGITQYQLDGVLNTFLLPDGSVGLITTEYDITGTYTKSMESHLYLIANNKKTLLAQFTDFDPSSSSIRFDDSIKITAKEWDRKYINWWAYDGKNGDWSKLITLDNKGRFLLVDLGNKQRVKIWWNDSGGDVKFQKL